MKKETRQRIKKVKELIKTTEESLDEIKALIKLIEIEENF